MKILSLSLNLNENSKMSSIILSKSSITEQSPLCRCFLSTHRVPGPPGTKDGYFLLQVLWTFVFNQAVTEQRHRSLISKLCFFLRSSLIKPGPLFMVSGSVYIVFLDKCQPMTFLKVIYSPQKADAVPAFVRLCSLVRSFTAIIFYISHYTRTCMDACSVSDTRTHAHTQNALKSLLNKQFFSFVFCYLQPLSCTSGPKLLGAEILVQEQLNNACSVRDYW